MKTCLLDADSLIYIVTHCKKKYNSKGIAVLDDLGEHVKEIKTLQDCKNDVDALIKNIMKTTKSTHYILTLTIGRNFRYEIRADYKANRKGERPNLFNEVRQYLIDEYNAISHENLESDDLVNIYNKALENSIIAACDSDILEGLEGIHFDYKKFKFVSTTKDKADYKFWHDMIAGTHNGVKGIPGRGTKFVGTIFNQYPLGQNYICGVLSEYVNHFGESNGIDEFYKNYKCMRILDKYDRLILIDPIKYDVENKQDEYTLVE